MVVSDFLRSRGTRARSWVEEIQDEPSSHYAGVRSVKMVDSENYQVRMIGVSCRDLGSWLGNPTHATRHHGTCAPSVW